MREREREREGERFPRALLFSFLFFTFWQLELFCDQALPVVQLFCHYYFIYHAHGLG